MTFTEWLKATHPTLKRSRPVAIIHSGSNQSIVGCLCGAQVSYASKWKRPKWVLAWIERHNTDCWPAGVEKGEQ